MRERNVSASQSRSTLPCRHAKTAKQGMENLNRMIVRMMRDAGGNNRGKNMKPAHGVIDRALHEPRRMLGNV